MVLLLREVVLLLKRDMETNTGAIKDLGRYEERIRELGLFRFFHIKDF